MLEQYQDIWIQGELRKKGVRDCEQRWETVRKVAERWTRPFTVLDVGANLGYFAIRLTEEFDCTVVAVEGVAGDWLHRILKENDNPRILLLQKNASIEELRQLADVEHFDLTLALSVVHHINAPYAETLAELRRMGDVLLLETATEDGACGQKIVRESELPEDSQIVGWGPSHLGGDDRPIVELAQEKPTLKRAYWDVDIERRARGLHLLDDIDLEIVSSYDDKRVIQRGAERPWYRGINLKTWLSMKGAYPSRRWIRRLVEEARPIVPHGDLKVHNAVLAGDEVRFVDFMDPRRVVEPDDLRFQQLLDEIGGA